MAIPDWQLPPGVDRGLWDYLHNGEMVAGYDAQMAASPLARRDVAFCERAFPTPGRLVDLGCGTGRLCVHFARKGYECVGVDLSPEMLAKAKVNADAAGVSVEWVPANLVGLDGLRDSSFDYAACLFSTLGMVRGEGNRRAAVAAVYRVLKPGGRFVLHVHNRYFRRLGWAGLWSGDITMSQAYAGAPLTLHHFSRGEAVQLLTGAGFRVVRCEPVGEGDEPLAGPWSWRRAYGYLLEAERSA
ncbi:MAG: class I SAM-dependent methyltransferase [Gemmataceae bacterium]